MTTGVPLHIFSSMHAPTLRGVLARPGPKVAIFIAEECRQLRMLCQRT